jgi:hypothetical protein
MKCIECGLEVERLYEEPVKGNIMLTNCTNCGKIADKFVEYEYTLIFINMILCKTQVYRHILFNIDFCDTLGGTGKLFLAICFLDVVLARCQDVKCLAIAVGNSLGRNLGYFGLVLLTVWMVQGKVEALKVVRAILLASFGKLGSFMIVTWNYSFVHSITMRFFIYLNHVIAIKECLQLNYVKAFGVIFLASLITGFNEYHFLTVSNSNV